jgi:hypothetical protein
MNWPWKRKTIVLGTELAAALEKEEARLAAGKSTPSPLPDNAYDFERGDYDLVAVSPLELDIDLRAVTNDFLVCGFEQQRELRNSLSFDDLYTLIHFVKRCSVLALNEEAMDWCRAGLVALSMIDETRVDWRDVKWAGGLLAHTILVHAEVRDRLNEEVPNFSRSAAEFLRSLPESSRLSEWWGYSEIETEKGVGLIQHGIKTYKPTINLTEIALQISASLTQNRYVAKVEIATDIPEIWFPKEKRGKAKSILSGRLGAATISGDLRKIYNASGPQMFVEWVAEMPDAQDCEYLVEAVSAGTTLSGRYAVGVSERTLFALLVAGSVQEGVAPFETPSSLGEFANQTRSILKRSFDCLDPNSID